MSETFTISGTIDKIYDERAMTVDGTRIGAPFKKDLADVATGKLEVGATVTVEYTQRGKWNNASSIVVTAPAPAGAAPSGGGGKGKGGGKGGEWRTPAELIRTDCTNMALAQLAGNEDFDLVNNTSDSMYMLVQTASIFEAYITGVVTMQKLKDRKNIEEKSPKPEPAPKPTPAAEAVAKEEAAPPPAPEPEVKAGATMDDFIAGI